jgi:hypothetical protein
MIPQAQHPAPDTPVRRAMHDPVARRPGEESDLNGVLTFVTDRNPGALGAADREQQQERALPANQAPKVLTPSATQAVNGGGPEEREQARTRERAQDHAQECEQEQDHEQERERHNPKPKQRSCLECGAQFEQEPRRGAPFKWCSEEC